MKRSKIIGIYMIRNKSNGKVYIGQSVDIYLRWKSHKKNLQKGCHRNIHLQNAWNKYGEDNFEFLIIEECNEDRLTKQEQYWIDFYGGLNSTDNYNKRDAGSIGHLSVEHKHKISLGNKGKIHSAEWVNKHRQAIKGRPSWNKGLTVKDERVQKYVRKVGCFHHTEETRLKISKTKKGVTPKRKNIEEWKRNLSEVAKGRKISEKHILQNRQAMIGRIWINNGYDTKMIHPLELDDYLKLGYKKGRGKLK